MYYKAFNLCFDIPFECLELLPIVDDEVESLEKVVVRFGQVPEHLECALQQWPVFESNENEILLKVKTVGNFLIRNGNEIIIERENDVSEDILRLYLLSPVVSALLQQKGYLTLHASAIRTARGAVLFAGNSGAGKSTTLQEFLRRGYEKLSDDMIALYWDESRGQVVCMPSYPQSKIWQGTADLFDHNTAKLRKIHPEMDKYALSTKSHFYNHELSLHSIYILEVSDTVEKVFLDEVMGLVKFKEINDNIYRNTYSYKLSIRQEHFRIASHISQHHCVMRAKRPKNRLTLSELCNIIESDFSKV